MKTLYIDIDEEITDVVPKIVNMQGKQFLLVIPKDARLFKNLLNMKVLKKKADEKEKVLQVFTNDEKGKKIVEKSGIKLYQGALRKRKIQRSAQLSSLPEKELGDTLQRKVSITDLSHKSRKKSSQKAISSAPQRKSEQQRQREWGRFFLINTLRKRTVMGFTLLAIAFFFVVLYVAIPSATIYLAPSTNVIEKTVNVTFADSVTQEALFRIPNEHIIPSVPIELIFERDLVYESTGKVFTGIHARCNLKVVNEKTSPWPLVSRTRFQDSAGIVFRIREAVEVPAARFQVVRDEEGHPSREKVPGTILVSVEADELDEGGNIIGERGNLKAGTLFTLPGLSPFNQTLLTALNEKPCVGGKTDFYAVVMEDDLKAAEQKIVEVMELAAKEFLQEYVANKNLERGQGSQDQQTGDVLELFDHPRAMAFEMLETSFPRGIVGERTDEFSVSGKMKVRGLAYERPAYYRVLEEGLASKVHPDKVLSSIEYQSTTYTIVYSDSDLDGLSRLKISVTVRGREEYNFDPRSDQGRSIIDQIMGYVPGKSKEQALYYIQNLEEIQTAHISIWPFWKAELPERVSSLSIKVR